MRKDKYISLMLLEKMLSETDNAFRITMNLLSLKQFCFIIVSQILLIRDMVVERWNRQFGCETIHPTQKFTSMNLLQITWA